MSFAMPGSFTDPLVALYRDQLMETKRAFFFWDRFTGMSSRRDDAMIGRDAWPADALASEKPVLVIPQGDGNRQVGRVETYKHRLGTKIEYNTVGVAGDATVKGTGGIDTLGYTELMYNRRRYEKPVRVGRWNEKLGGDWQRQLVAANGPDMMELHMRDKAWYGVAHALFYGHSSHIVYDSNIGIGMSSDPAVGGLAESLRLHENFCIPGLPSGTGAGYRYPTWSATHATYMAAVAVNLSYMTDENKFKAGLLWLQVCLQEMENKLKVGRMGGERPRYWLAVTPGQWQQLINDPYLKDQIIFDHQKAKDQSETFLGGDSFVWSGIRVFNGGYRGPARVSCYYPADTLATTNGPGKTTGPDGNAAARVVFGFVSNAFVPYNMADSEINDSYAADDGTKPWLSRDVAIGGAYKPMILGLDIWKPEFLKETDDYENTIGMALDAGYGFSRVTRYNNPSPASATTSVNDRSILFGSYSPRFIQA